jgi:hypothetical protein
LLVGDSLLDRAETSLTSEITRRAYTIGQDLAASAKNPLVTRDELTLSLLVRDALRDEEVSYAIIADDAAERLLKGLEERQEKQGR